MKALYPLIEFNLKNIREKGTINSLTGPVERGDLVTVINHLNVLREEDKELYRLLSRYFEKDDIVNFSDSYEATQVYEFGKCAIFTNHGDFSNGKPLQRFLKSLVFEFPDTFGRTIHRSARLGH